ncbi:uncharacterized protein [Macrobrachium rosenbergii]|uniref:uncharacterized protein n=1 Tax=Macrobrachium rosenbergii TaxID=79674 RepID=UPI0034D6DAD9
MKIFDFEKLENLVVDKLSLECRVGFDGTSGQSIDKQSLLANVERNLAAENSLYITCMVPLELNVTLLNRENKIVIWKNAKPSSSLFIRPITFKFSKETRQVLADEDQFIENCISNLRTTEISDELLVHHNVSLTMIDRKVVAALSTVTNSMECCSICGASPKTLNNIEEEETRPLSQEALKHGLPTLHAWISKDSLVKAQKNDPTLNKAVDKKDLVTNPGFYFEGGILMRRFRPADCPAEEWSEVHQVILPKCFRDNVMSMAHDGIQGHLGVHKTFQKIPSHFFWPKMKADVSKYIQTCHVCQLVGKANKPIPPAPLSPIPVVIQHDQGSNFTSKLFAEIMKGLGVDQCFSTVYLPESQGALERFHQTFKTMVRKIHQIQYSHFLSFFVKLKTTFSQVQAIATENLRESQVRMKCNYDHKSKVRTFQPGDRVLVFMPVSGGPFEAKYSGPYLIKEKVDGLNNVLSTPDRGKGSTKMHVNLLKGYHGRMTETDSSHDRNLGDKNPHLDNEKLLDLIHLFEMCPDVVKDELGSCTILKHDVILTEEATPIKQSPYRLNPQKRLRMKEAVQYLLTNGLIKPCCSPWASPSLLTPKEDGTDRLCTDFRKVNELTVTDSFPLPRLDDLIDSVGNEKFVTKIDLQKGYYQALLTPKATEISALLTPDGLYKYLRMPFGMKNAPATFQRIINYVIRDLEGIFAYLDDLLVVSKTWTEHIQK